MQPWDPWKELGKRRHLVYRVTKLPPATGGALYWPVGRRAGVFIDPGVDRVRRRCLIAHELVHDERRGRADCRELPRSWDAVVAREEGWVDDIVARRLVPAAALMAFCRATAEMGEGVTATAVAEQFDVTEEIAERALRLLEKERLSATY